MQNTIEKGMKIHPVGTLIAVLACMIIFYVCNVILLKFSKNTEEDITKELKQRVEDVKIGDRGVIDSETAQQDKIEDLKGTERDIEKERKDKIRPRTAVEAKQVPVLVKT